LSLDLDFLLQLVQIEHALAAVNGGETSLGVKGPSFLLSFQV
jgi:hypothetical protein